MTVRIAYLVHDLTDPAVERRVTMLRAGGADVIVLGFRREEAAPSSLGGASVVDLGRTYDARLAHRAWSVAKRLAAIGPWARTIGQADVLMARNLEMFVLAAAVRSRLRLQAGLVYECLDVHRLMFGSSAAGALLRSVERNLLRQAELIVMSSPAFVSAYFRPRQGLGRTLHTPTLMVENKPLVLTPSDADQQAAAPAAGPPWRIGWFGMIRCRRSLDLLCRLAMARPGGVEVVIRGRPALTEFDDFHAQIARTPGVSFGGLYPASELQALYASVHFNWAIDWFEDGANSDLLLPNRLYEGGRYGAVPIARAGVESARWLAERGHGVVLEDPEHDLQPFLDGLPAEAYQDLKQAVTCSPPQMFVADKRDCRRLVSALGEAAARRRGVRASAAEGRAARDAAPQYPGVQTGAAPARIETVERHPGPVG